MNQSNAIYERLAHSYNVRFEGSRYPVFYKTFYPTGGISGPESAALWTMFDYATGLKQDKDPDGIRFAKTGRQRYEQDVRDLLDAVLENVHWSRCAIAVIPSSTKGVTNRATEIVRSVLDENPTLAVDLTNTIVRVSDKQAAHLGGSRSIEARDDSFSIDPNIASVFDTIVVIDDILTSGNSFKTFDRLLESVGFEGNIVNFAFAHTRASKGVEVCIGGIPKAKSTPIREGHQVTLRDGSEKYFAGKFEIVKKAQYRKTLDELGRREAIIAPRIKLAFGQSRIEEFDDINDVKRRVKRVRYTPPIDALVLDFDQTIVDSSVRDASYEEHLWEHAGPIGRDRHPSPYKAYSGVEGIVGLGIPFAIVSNRSEKQLSGILSKADIAEALYPGCLNAQDASSGSSGDTPANVFSFPKEEKGGFTIRHYKPNPLGVERAVEWLRQNNPEIGDEPRILGLGNTPEDIAAYNAAGIESALALWGVPEWCREIARAEWNAGYAFDDVEDFSEWCRGGGLPISAPSPKRTAGGTL